MGVARDPHDKDGDNGSGRHGNGNNNCSDSGENNKGNGDNDHADASGNRIARSLPRARAGACARRECVRRGSVGRWSLRSERDAESRQSREE
eukprot:gene15369-biopygen1564